MTELGRAACAAVDAEADNDSGESASVGRRIVELRLLGQESTLSVDLAPGVALAEAFARRYAAVFGHPPPAGKPIEVESARAVARRGGTARRRTSSPSKAPAAKAEPKPPAAMRARFSGIWEAVPVWEREGLAPGSGAVAGPALIVERYSTVVVEPGWTAAVDPASGALILRSGAQNRDEKPESRDADAPVREELFAGRFAGIAEEMGETLRRTALSTNVKERLDFSCAVLGPDGELVASAAHIPVHLGALGACVRAVQGAVALEPGDVIVMNHPAYGGSHLPDVTVITPVYAPGDGPLLGYVASRAHHAEIGGTRPGSMPPDATTLAEEGVVLPPTYLMRAGRSRLDAVCGLLRSAPYPSRAVADNRADLEAALAAGRRGADALRELAARHGAETAAKQMRAVTARAERLLRRALAALPDGAYAASERLDDGAVIAVTITIAGDQAEVDFAGTAEARPGNLNAPPAVAASVVLYVMRLLVGEPIPLNEGLLRPVTLRLPQGTLVNPIFDRLDPTRCPAVVGGNTEVSQRIGDTLLKALGLCACSQGTMNNVLFGNGAFGYYETVCGGAGATPNAPGAHAVHTHMTNTRITDPEVLEHRYPVRLERFAVRRGSGGSGRHPGGDGAIREIVFLAPMTLSVLTQHRVEKPYGMTGGDSGQPGSQRLVRETGEVAELDSIDGCEVLPGDRLILETPGGGGWGRGIRTDG